MAGTLKSYSDVKISSHSRNACLYPAQKACCSIFLPYSITSTEIPSLACHRNAGIAVPKFHRLSPLHPAQPLSLRSTCHKYSVTRPRPYSPLHDFVCLQRMLLCAECNFPAGVSVDVPVPGF